MAKQTRGAFPVQQRSSLFHYHSMHRRKNQLASDSHDCFPKPTVAKYRSTTLVSHVVEYNYF